MDYTLITITAIICTTSIAIYVASIFKSKAEKERIEAMTEMYKAEHEIRFRPQKERK